MPSTKSTARKANTKIIHFVADGLTRFGIVWYRGQEIHWDKLTERQKDQAKSWWDLTPGEQIKRYGELKFVYGKWSGDPWEGKAATEEKKRGGAVPKADSKGVQKFENQEWAKAYRGE